MEMILNHMLTEGVVAGAKAAVVAGVAAAIPTVSAHRMNLNWADFKFHVMNSNL